VRPFFKDKEGRERQTDREKNIKNDGIEFKHFLGNPDTLFVYRRNYRSNVVHISSGFEQMTDAGGVAVISSYRERSEITLERK
jgi:hypothetical protein